MLSGDRKSTSSGTPVHMLVAGQFYDQKWLKSGRLVPYRLWGPPYHYDGLTDIGPLLFLKMNLLRELTADGYNLV